jgi:hypothetical protein
MKRIVTIFSVLFIALSAFGQVNESFSSTNFPADYPTWSGTTGNFKVNASNQLQLNATEAGTSYLATPISFIEDMEWDFWVKLNFSPSNDNNTRIYLLSNNSDLTGTLNGYYIKLGENLANDPIELFKQSGTTSTSLCRGTAGLVANAFAIRIKVIRSAAGIWNIYVDQTGGKNYHLDATASDLTFSSGTWFGMYCKYTKTNSTNFYFDDIYAGPIIPPTVTSTTVTESTKQIKIVFSEAMSPMNETNFSLSNGFGAPTTATLSADKTTATLTYTNSFTPADYTLTLTGITNLAGKALDAQSATQTFTIEPLNATGITMSSSNRINVSFSKAINPVTTANFSLSDGQVPTAVTLANDAKSVVLNLANNLISENEYTLTMNGITDTGGNVLTNPVYPFTVPFFVTLVQDDFSDGDFTNDPTWGGDEDAFVVEDKVLRSNVGQLSAANSYYLSTASSLVSNCEWDFWVNLKFSVSGSNYVDLFLISDNENLKSTSLNGYFVRIGETDKKISLYKKTSSSSTPISLIDGDKNVVSSSSNNLFKIKVIRKEDNSWALSYDNTGTGNSFSPAKIAPAEANPILTSSYMGISIQQSTAKDPANNHYFDDIYAGPIIPDTISPMVNGISVDIDNKNKVIVTYSESIKPSSVSNYMLSTGEIPLSTSLSVDEQRDTLTFASTFVSGTIYTLYIDKIDDLAGNPLDAFVDGYRFGITETPELGDLIINEIMFNNPDNAEEYVEIYNKSNKILDVSGVRITTMKTTPPKEGQSPYNTGATIPQGTTILPSGYLALCKTPDIERNYFATPDTAQFAIVAVPSLNNDGATLVLCSSSYDIVFDSLTYSSKWHNPIVQNKKGVALERINPDMPSNQSSSWTSAAADVNYGTPGYKNSQYTDINPTTQPSKDFWLDNDVFTPNGDGDKDVLLIHYKLAEPSWTANISIFDATGQRIKKLYRNYTLSTEGTLTWDGSTDKEKLANIGIYVIYIEIFNMPLGETRKYKLPAVVSGKK